MAPCKRSSRGYSIRLCRRQKLTRTFDANSLEFPLLFLIKFVGLLLDFQSDGFVFRWHATQCTNYFLLIFVDFCNTVMDLPKIYTILWGKQKSTKNNSCYVGSLGWIQIIVFLVRSFVFPYQHMSVIAVCIQVGDKWKMNENNDKKWVCPECLLALFPNI